MFGIYLILNGAERFLIEFIRVNTRYHIWGISFPQAQLIAICLFIAGIVLVIPAFNKDKKTYTQHG